MERIKVDNGWSEEQWKSHWADRRKENLSTLEPVVKEVYEFEIYTNKINIKRNIQLNNTEELSKSVGVEGNDDPEKDDEIITLGNKLKSIRI